MSRYPRAKIDRRAFVTSSACLAAMLSAGGVCAQVQFPTRPVKIIVPFAAGGPTDVLGRILGEALAAKWPHPVIIENRPGAGTIVGTDAVVRSAPDGHTIGIVISAHMINPAVRDRLPYDTQRDLMGVAQLTEAHIVLVAHPALPVDTVPAFVEFAKAQREPLAYATPGPATATHLAGELLQRAAGIKLLHVPYNGSAPALVDVLADRVPVMFDIWHSVRQHVQAGKLKVLGVTNVTRIPGEPRYPTIAETFPGYEASSVVGMVIAAGTPADILKKLSTDVSAVVRSADLAARIRGLGMEPVGSTPEDFEKRIASEITKWRKIAADAGIKVN